MERTNNLGNNINHSFLIHNPSMKKQSGHVIYSFLNQLDPVDLLLAIFFIHLTVLSFSVTKAFANLRPGMLSLLWCSCQGRWCDIQYVCFPSLQSHLHLTPDICIMALLYLPSSEIQGGSKVVCVYACVFALTLAWS